MRSAFVLAAATAAIASASPLWDYVHRVDPTYTYSDTGVRLNNQSGWTGYLLNVTSQTWLTEADTNRPIWSHQALVVMPSVLKYNDTGAIWITGGSDGDGTPDPTDEDVLVCAALATFTGTVCTVLYQTPNQPIIFTADPLQKSRSEDGAVAFTWSQWMLNNSNVPPEMILYFPMVKGAVRAMDSTSAFVTGMFPNVNIGKWMVMGASKRGWTTWLTGAVGNAVAGEPTGAAVLKQAQGTLTDADVAAGPGRTIIGIAPVVMDLLSFKEGVMHMYQTLGGWTFAFTDYYEMNITKYLTTPYIDILSASIDPLNYKANLTMPKLVIDATGDEFFQVQDDSFWWGQLPGETLRMMVDNAEHSMATGALYLITGVEAWYQALLSNVPRPAFNWTIDPTTQAITLTAYGTKPKEVVMRFTQTIGPERRDFRLVAGDTPANPCIKGIPLNLFGKACLYLQLLWIGEKVGVTSTGTNSWTYVLQQPPPTVGWRAFLGEVYYHGPPGIGGNSTFQLTTQVSVVPNTFPFPPCVGDGCISVLV